VKHTALERVWTGLVAAELGLLGAASWRAGEDMQTVAAVLMYGAAALSVASWWVPSLHDGLGAAVRVGFASSSLVFRALSLIVVGSHRLDRPSELIGAGAAMVFAAAIVLVRMQFEVIRLAARLATD